MKRRELWHHEPLWDWQYPDEANTAALLLGMRKCVCTVCGVRIQDHSLTWPSRPAFVLQFVFGVGRVPSEAHEYPAWVRWLIGFGPGLWIISRKSRVVRRGWRRVL